MRIRNSVLGGKGADPKRLFPDPGPEPTFQVIPDLGQNQTLLRTQNEIFFTNHLEVFSTELLYCFH